MTVYTEFVDLLKLIRSCKKTKIDKKFNKFFINDLITEYETHLTTLKNDTISENITMIYISLFQYTFSKNLIDIKGKQRLIKNGTFPIVTKLDYLDLINDSVNEKSNFEMDDKLFEKCVFFRANNIFDYFAHDFFTENKVTNLYNLSIEYNNEYVFLQLMKFCTCPNQSDFEKLLNFKNINVSKHIDILDVFFESQYGFSIIEKIIKKEHNLKTLLKNVEYESLFFQYVSSVMLNYCSKEVLISLINICDIKWKTQKNKDLEYLPFDVSPDPFDNSGQKILDPYCLSEYVLNTKNVDKKYEIHRTILRKLGLITRNTDTNSKYTIDQKKEKLQKCFDFFNIEFTKPDERLYEILIENPEQIKKMNILSE